MNDHWSYDNKQHLDKAGEQWHFVWRSYLNEDVPYYERPVEIYFRNDSKTYFGCLRFEKQEDNPYKYEKLVEKVLNNADFREKCAAPETEDAWNKNWK